MDEEFTQQLEYLNGILLKWRIQDTERMLDAFRSVGRTGLADGDVQRILADIRSVLDNLNQLIERLVLQMPGCKLH